jgi:Flp pilus assembly protein TadG
VTRRSGGIRRSGQAMVEMVIILPLMVLLFLGSWTAGDLIGDNDTALQGTRAGARYAAELGGTMPTLVNASLCTSTYTNDIYTCQVDLDIIDQVLPVVAGNMPNAVVSEIDIYQPPGSGNGCTFNAATAGTTGGCPPQAPYQSGDYVDVYPISGNAVSSVPATYSISCASSPNGCYPLSQREGTHPFEAELGVRIVFTYTSPTLKLFTQTDSQYTIVRLAPVE